jgi:hypothetical protein
LTYSDDECRLHAVSLPELEPVRAPSFQMCRPATGSGGLGAIDGEVVWAGLGYGFVQVVLSREELSRAIRQWLSLPPGYGGFRAVQAVALDEDRFVVLADSTDEPDDRVVAGFDEERVRFVQPRGDAQWIRPSPRGGYYALFAPDELVRVFTRNGEVLGQTLGAWPHAIAWSPDERWTALATRWNVYVYRTESPSDAVARIPLTVRDLDWGE